MIKTRRVGTLTLGGMLVTFGTLFLLRIFIDNLSYAFLFKLWPVVFILLGLEILAANFVQKDEKLVYDKTAFALIIILSFFTMGMAIMDLFLTYAQTNMTITW